MRKKSRGSNEALGDLCVDLQKGGKDRCPYLPPMSEPAKLNAFRDKALVSSWSACPPVEAGDSLRSFRSAQASVRDIEDIEDLGRQMHTCPYYGSRKAVRSAEVVTLPYNMLMQKSAREALGISLKE